MPSSWIRIGAHMSVAGGVSKAVDRAMVNDCEALQIFCKNASQWQGKPIPRDEILRFRQRVEESGVRPVVSHASYLINLATAAPGLRSQSLAAFLDELDRAESLGLLGVVIHPGTCTDGPEEDALGRVGHAILAALDARPHQRAMVLLENTAGQGRNLGYRFEHLARILEGVDGSPRVGVCLDTCHLLASGYDIATVEGYEATFDSFRRLVGLDRLRIFHGNDSKRPCGSRVDRHEHVGRGHVGRAAFWRVLHDPRFASLAMLIETEKSPGTGRAGAIEADPLDRRNLNTLRRLRAAPIPPRSRVRVPEHRLTSTAAID